MFCKISSLQNIRKLNSTETKINLISFDTAFIPIKNIKKNLVWSIYNSDNFRDTGKGIKKY